MEPRWLSPGKALSKAELTGQACLARTPLRRLASIVHRPLLRELASHLDLRNSRGAMVNSTPLLWIRRLAVGLWAGAACVRVVTAGLVPADVDKLAGQPADIAPSAYLFRADRAAEKNPPEAWVLLMQHANLPFDQPVDWNAPAVKHTLSGLLWEEVRPVRRLVLSWPRGAKNRPAPDQLVVSCFNGQDDTAHTWWNPRTVKEAALPEVSADGCTYSYAIPVDTWGVVAAVRGPKEASAFAVPALQAFAADQWKQMDVEIEWGYEPARATLAYDGHIEVYDGRLALLQALEGDNGTRLIGPSAWRSASGKSSPEGQKGKPQGGVARRGMRFRLLYIGDSRWRRVWPYHAQAEDVARTIVTVWTTVSLFWPQTSNTDRSWLPNTASSSAPPGSKSLRSSSSRSPTRRHPRRCSPQRWIRSRACHLYAAGPRARRPGSVPTRRPKRASRETCGSRHGVPPCTHRRNVMWPLAGAARSGAE